MARQRFGVVLLVAEPVATEIQGLRRALGDRSFDRVAPHITLVPPVNVRGQDISEVLAILRFAGEQQRRAMTLELGPARSFVPDSDAAYLAVGGDDATLAALDTLRRVVSTGPLERTLEFAFVPHCTIGDGIGRDRIAAGVAALADYVVPAMFDRMHLLEEQRIDGHRRWVPIADAPFAAPAIVGRGGVELELTTTTLADPEGLAVIDADSSELAESAALDQRSVRATARRTTEIIPEGTTAVVVTARRAGSAVGVACGWSHPELQGDVTLVAVAPEHHGQGIGSQLRAALESKIG